MLVSSRSRLARIRGWIGRGGYLGWSPGVPGPAGFGGQAGGGLVGVAERAAMTGAGAWRTSWRRAAGFTRTGQAAVTSAPLRPPRPTTCSALAEQARKD